MNSARKPPPSFAKICHLCTIIIQQIILLAIKTYLSTYESIKLKFKICIIFLFQAATVDKLAKVLKECEEFDALKALTPTSLQNT